MISVEPLFPVHFFAGKIANPEEILIEIQKKKEEIRRVSESSQEQSSETYKTDYTRPIKLLSFETQIQGFLDQLRHQKLKGILSEYWTAIYSGSGHHSPHTHSMSIFDTSNYSGVLYLSEGSGTQFYCPSVSCAERHTTFHPRFGDVIMFPSTILHAYVPQNCLSTNERCIVSFNLNITGVENG